MLLQLPALKCMRMYTLPPSLTISKLASLFILAGLFIFLKESLNIRDKIITVVQLVLQTFHISVPLTLPDSSILLPVKTIILYASTQVYPQVLMHKTAGVAICKHACHMLTWRVLPRPISSAIRQRPRL